MRTKLHVGFLDGIRGMAAFWVMTGHILLAYGFKLPVVTWVSLPVDAFIILSGFLMVHQALARESREPLDRPRSWVLFWIRRFFRIAPLYYLLLIVVVVASQYSRGFDGAFQYPTWDGTRVEYNAFALNSLNHLTFTFGLFPEFQRANLLPDWSISLEMQFYATFPFLMIIGNRLGWLIFVSIIAFASMAMDFGFSSILHQYTLPSILLLKINVFLAGMLIALAMHESTKQVLYLVAAIVLVALPIWGSENYEMDIYRMMIVFGISGLAFSASIKDIPILSPLLAATAALLGTRPMVLMATLSYGVYLIHFPVLSIWLWATDSGKAISTANPICIALLSVTVVTYALAWMAHHSVEQPGIYLGRRISDKLRSRAAVPRSNPLPTPLA